MAEKPVQNLSAENRELDQVLVTRAQQGDKKAFGLLVDKYHRKLGRLLSRMIRDQAEVEDVVQESFIKAYRALHNFRGDSAFYTWLYRIGINTAKNYLVSMGRKPQVMQEVEIEDVENFDQGIEMRTMDTPETAMMTKEIAQTVNDTIANLPDELRTAITLRELEGLSYEDIAVIMQCPIGTVRSRIFRARETIASKLRPLLDTPEHKRW
jgi:RNA polymerase sigma-70 factor (ECF subfamily)